MISIGSVLLSVALTIPGLSWGMTDAQLDSWTKKQGWEGKLAKSNGYVYSRGTFAGRSFLMANAGTCRQYGLHTVIIGFDANEGNYKSIYKNLVDLYKGKYGEPSEVFHFFRSPFKEGDGYEWVAVRAGKAAISTYWETQDKDGTIGVEVDKPGVVYVTYQSNRAFNKCKDVADTEAMGGI
jgi:hypothetical protein